MLAVLAVLSAGCGAGPEPAADGRGVSVPPGLAFPYRVEPACPGEGCAYGSWLACDSVLLYEDPQDSGPGGSYLLPGRAFDVTTGAVIVDAPTVVAVTAPRRQVLAFSEDAITFQPGDTLYVLDYLGEGFFNAWHADSVLEVEVFWPWESFMPGEDFEYGGEVVQEGEASFWVNTRGPDGTAGWVWVDSSSVAANSALEPGPPICPAG